MRHHGGSLLDLLARSVLWHAVGRLIWRSPVLVVLVLVVVAGLWLLRRRRLQRN